MLTPKEHKRFTSYVQDMDVKRLAAAFDALSEPNRCLIFRALLQENSVNVGQIASAMDISESLTSQHLKILLRSGLVTRRKEGKNVYYLVKENDPLVDALKHAVEA